MADKVIILGSEVKDTITGFKGIALGRAEWLYGCARIAVQQKVGKDNMTIPDAQWVDEPQLEVIKKARKKAVKKEKPGGSSTPVGLKRSVPRR